MIIEIPPQVNRALFSLSSAGFEAYVVGGAVRDAIMGKNPVDWDITTSAMPEQTTAVFSDFSVHNTGIKHGTVTAVIDSLPLEITTFRIEKSYSDNRHPDTVEFTDNITLDLARRDFTVNAMAYNPQSGLVDPYGGAKDIENRIIRCVGEPDKRFNEDGLRILRALRFSSVLRFSIEEKTSAAIHKNRHLLKNISAERIFSEFYRMIACCNAEFLNGYSDIIAEIIPELPHFSCNGNYRSEIFGFVGRCPENSELRLAALLSNSDLETVNKIMQNFRTSTAVRNHVCTLTEMLNLNISDYTARDYRKLIGRTGKELVGELFRLKFAQEKEPVNCLKSGYEIFRKIAATENCFCTRDLEINGRDLEKIGIKQGRETGTILENLLEEVISEKIKNEKSALMSRAEEMYSDGNS